MTNCKRCGRELHGGLVDYCIKCQIKNWENFSYSYSLKPIWNPMHSVIVSKLLPDDFCVFVDPGKDDSEKHFRVVIKDLGKTGK